MSATTDYEIVRLNGNNLADVARVHHLVYHRKQSVEELRHKYDTRYLGLEYLGYLAYYDGQPVAFCGLIPTAAHKGDQVEISAQIMDLMIVKSHQRKGLFSVLVNHIMKLAEELGIHFLWGFCTDVSQRPVIEKAGFQSTDYIQGYRFIGRQRILDRVFKKSPIFRRIVTKRIERRLHQVAVNKPFQGSLHTLTDHPVILRNEAYFHYKSYSSAFFIELENVKFWVKVHPHHGIMIGDIEASSSESLRNGLIALRKLIEKHALGVFTVQISPQTPLEKTVSELADETFVSWCLCYRSIHSSFPLNKLKVTCGDLDTF